MNENSAQVVPRLQHLRLAAFLLILSVVVYLLAETMTAAAWTQPSYDYVDNSLSDLGLPDCGVYDRRLSCSPLRDVYNWSFYVQGPLLGLAFVLISRALSSRALRMCVMVMGVIIGVSYVLFGAIPVGSATQADGTIIIHNVAAVLILVGSNATGVIVGLSNSRLGLTSAISRVTIVLGLIGITATIVFLSTFYILPPGAPQRVALYAALVWEVIVSVHILSKSRTHPSTPGR